MEPRRDRDEVSGENAEDMVKLPEERVEDLAPHDDDADDVRGGGWPVKWSAEP